jgi:hypothetical protein
MSNNVGGEVRLSAPTASAVLRCVAHHATQVRMPSSEYTRIVKDLAVIGENGAILVGRLNV